MTSTNYVHLLTRRIQLSSSEHDITLQDRAGKARKDSRKLRRTAAKRQIFVARRTVHESLAKRT